LEICDFDDFDLLAIEGWILFVSNVHQEAQDEDLLDMFADYGEIGQIDLNLDRRTGFVKGYALVSYGSYEEADRARRELDGKSLFDQVLQVDWAFSGGSLRSKPKKKVLSTIIQAS
jgi:RNA-binding protein 8A